MRRAYNELKSIVITPVAPMHPCTCTCVRVGGTHNAIYACEGDRSIDDNRWRRTKNRGGGEGGRRYGKVVERQGMVEEEWCRKSEGNVSSLFLSLSIPYLSRFDEEGQRWKLGGETTRLTLVEPRSIIYGLVSNRHVSDQKGLDKGERSEASLNGTLLGGEI